MRGGQTCAYGIEDPILKDGLVFACAKRINNEYSHDDEYLFSDGGRARAIGLFF